MNPLTVTFLNELTGVLPASHQFIRHLYHCPHGPVIGGRTSALVFIGYQRVVSAAVLARRLFRIAIDEGAVVHRVMKAANLVLDLEKAVASLWIHDFLESELMVAHVFGN